MENVPKPVIDDLHVHKTTILRWIQSCVSHVQIPLCEEVVKKLVTDRFVLFVANRQLNILDLNIVEEELYSAIEKQKTTIAQRQLSNEAAT